MPPEITVSRALLLQGPIGPFFRRLADELRGRGVEVTKVNFNVGDTLFFRGPEVVPFRAPMAEWPAFFRALVAGRGIDTIFLFGDCRPHHKEAVRIAGELGLAVWVFEEGYLRPDYITLERGGVNGNSSLPKDPEFYRHASATLPAPDEPVPVGNTFRPAGWYAAAYSTALTLAGWRYPHYRHHRDYNGVRQGLLWVRGAARKLWYAARERDVLPWLQEEHSDRYFLVPLQVHCDAQLSHSRYESIEAFIEEVVASFAAHAPGECLLVLKHHPHDRPYRDYTRYLRDLGETYGCGERLVYVHDLHLPTLLKHARGVITMNSTVGTSALHHKTPVKVLGDAIYDVEGLTSQRSLSEFFHEPGAVDMELYDAFCKYLRATNQLNGSFYRRVAGTAVLGHLPVVCNFAPVAPDAAPLRQSARG